MAVPQEESVETVLRHHVEVGNPLLLIVKPGEVLTRQRIFINRPARKVFRFLKPDAGPPQYHFRMIRKIKASGNPSRTAYLFSQFQTTIQKTVFIAASNGNSPAFRSDPESLLHRITHGKPRIVSEITIALQTGNDDQRLALIFRFPGNDHTITRLPECLLQPCDTILRRISLMTNHQGDIARRAGKECPGEHEKNPQKKMVPGKSQVSAHSIRFHSIRFHSTNLK